MDCEIIVPWRGGDRLRERAWAYVRGRYRAEHPDWPLRIGVGRGEPAEAPGRALDGRTEARWVKARALMPEIEASEADTVVVADADCWSDGLPEALEEVEQGAPWAIPHKGVLRLSEAGSEAIYAGEPLDEQLGRLEQRGYRGIEGGGILVAPREALLAVPLDARFVGWGQEDESWGIALRTLLGPPWRGKHVLWHLYHEPQNRRSRRWGSAQNRKLARRYIAARNSPATMLRLVEEGRL